VLQFANLSPERHFGAMSHNSGVMTHNFQVMKVYTAKN
jgi:hypothetical protein